jgi:hypothetical protein
MAPSALTVIRSAFLDMSEVTLGCLVPNPVEPGQDSWPLKPPIFAAEQVNKRSIKGIYESLGAGRHVGLRAKLTRVFSARARMEAKSVVELIAPTSTLYYLKHPKMHFKSLCEDDDTKEWIEDTLKHFPIFLVVGLLTVTEAEIERAQQKSAELRAGVEVPVTEIVASGATTPIPDADVANVGIEIEAGVQAHSLYSFIAPGERIIGVQYRKLHFSLFSAVNVEKSNLEENRWVMFLGDRDHRGVLGEKGDVLEADLEESLTMDDLELDDRDEDAYNANVEDEEFVFLEK